MRASAPGRRRNRRKLVGLSRTLGRERGFTILELAIVSMIIGIMLTIVVVSYISGTRKSEVVAATEQVKEVLRSVYSLANAGTETAGVRRQFRITFNNAAQTPSNACLIEWSADGLPPWTAVGPNTNGGSYKVVSTNWVQLGSQDIRCLGRGAVENGRRISLPQRRSA